MNQLPTANQRGNDSGNATVLLFLDAALLDDEGDTVWVVTSSFLLPFARPRPHWAELFSDRLPGATIKHSWTSYPWRVSEGAL